MKMKAIKVAAMLVGAGFSWACCYGLCYAFDVPYPLAKAATFCFLLRFVQPSLKVVSS